MTISKLYTIGFKEKSAEEFFTKLQRAGIKKVLDIRLSNTSQLAGFSKRNHLPYFLRELCNIDYKHMPLLAPTEEILANYKKGEIDWSAYERQFKGLIERRKIENLTTCDELNDACLLCSEPTPERCHRRLVAEYLKKKLGAIEIVHL